MSGPSEPPAVAGSSSFRPRQFGEWALIGVVAVAATAIVCLQLPPRLKSMVPVPILFAAVAGWLLAKIAGRIGLPAHRSAVFGAALLIAAGIAGMHIGNWTRQSAEIRQRRLAELREDAAERLSGSLAARQMFESAAPPESEYDRKLLEDLRQSLDRNETILREQTTEQQMEQRFQKEFSFWNWLNSRRLRKGTWTAPWPAVFTGGELLLSAVLGAWIFTRNVSLRPRALTGDDPVCGGEARGGSDGPS